MVNTITSCGDHWSFGINDLNIGLPLPHPSFYIQILVAQYRYCATKLTGISHPQPHLHYLDFSFNLKKHQQTHSEKPRSMTLKVDFSDVQLKIATSVFYIIISAVCGPVSSEQDGLFPFSAQLRPTMHHFTSELKWWFSQELCTDDLKKLYVRSTCSHSAPDRMKFICDVLFSLN